MNDKIQDKPASLAHRSPGWWVTALGLHLLGVTGVFCLSVIALLPAETRQALAEAYEAGAFETIPFEVWIHLGLSACVWAMVAIIYQLLVGAAKEDRKPRLVKARGTVILETILVFPVFLLVTLGLMQLTLVNSAGLLTNLASFQGARAAAVWYPEAERERNDADMDVVHQKTRLAAASAVAPLAPVDFTYDGCGQEDNPSFEARIEMLAAQGQDTDTAAGARGDGDRPSLSLARAFDHNAFSERGQRKLTFAYCATDVDISLNESDETVEVVVQYQQQMAVPIAEVIFGEWGEVAGREAFYSTYERRHTMPHQLFPNREDQVPGGWVDLGEAFSGTNINAGDFDDYEEGD